MTITEFCGKVNNEVPWNRGDWNGKFYSFDGTSIEDFGAKDVARAIAANHLMLILSENWDGIAAAVVQLRDGRWVAWESNWGPTGSGFNADAYGGDADVYFSSDLADVIARGLTTEGRELLKLDLENLGDPSIFNFEDIEITK